MNFKDAAPSSSSPSSRASEEHSLSIEDKAFLLAEDNQKKFRACHRPLSLRNISLVLNFVFFIAGLSVWAHAHYLLCSFSCDGSIKEDHFEPDLVYDTKITFQPHAYMGGPPSNETDEMWQRISPPGDGIVEVLNEATENLPASLPAPNNDETHKVYGISMFHQLHCLNFLRFAYWPERIPEMPADEVGYLQDHCLDYIRQAIQCNGDVTFEPLTEAGINGMGAIHRCRNFDKIFTWGYRHRSDKIKGSGYTAGKVTHIPGHRNHLGTDEEDEEGKSDGHHD
ncbi:hypothetical protein F5Y19DRAFT_445823 [Neofusicoccum parvum]|uniref:Uncharacterized protein n=1 Tax=Neofusicoccum parvum TaxID=310453 RepID=A0ACB5SBV0_9PEZI|nr:hypothetical protein F5Y19DRAFT_445823 [Neofusicoccum parvum]